MMYKIRPEKPHTADLKYWNRSMTLNTEAEQVRIMVKKNMYVNQKNGKIISMRCGVIYDAIVVFIVQREGNYKWKYIFTDERGIICSSSNLSSFIENRIELRNSRIDQLLGI